MSASDIVSKMMTKDAFSQWLHIQIIKSESGACKLQMTIRPDMCNGFGIVHGGIIFSLADSALAFASNGHGRHALSIQSDISIHQSGQIGDVIYCDCEEIHRSHKIGKYRCRVFTDTADIAAFSGMVYFKSETWE